MQRCKKCGNEFSTTDKFCPECGLKVEIISNRQNKKRRTLFDIPIHIIVIAGVAFLFTLAFVVNRYNQLNTDNKAPQTTPKHFDTEYGADLSHITIQLQKEIFVEIVMAEDKGQKEADKKYPIRTSASEKELVENIEYSRERTAIFKKEVQVKYKLTEAELRAIGIKGAVDFWPMPEY